MSSNDRHFPQHPGGQKRHPSLLIDRTGVSASLSHLWEEAASWSATLLRRHCTGTTVIAHRHIRDSATSGGRLPAARIPSGSPDFLPIARGAIRIPLSLRV